MALIISVKKLKISKFPDKIIPKGVPCGKVFLIALLIMLMSILVLPSDIIAMARKKVVEFTGLRQQMVKTQIANRGITDERVLVAMKKIPRHLFVPGNLVSQAYKDHPLPIGYGQTISQPYMVALMTQCLELTGKEKILEIGTGSGYQAAILAELVEKKVYTIEIIEELGMTARRCLRELGYKNIVVGAADGYFGWKEKAPFDRIIVTCAPDHVPPPLAEQLNEGGIMVIPVGPPGSYQTLWKIKKHNGKLIFKNMGGCIFVPFRRKQ